MRRLSSRLQEADDPDQPKTLLTASYDGLVTLWAADTLEPMHRMHLAHPPWGMLRVGPDRVVIHLANEVSTLYWRHSAACI